MELSHLSELFGILGGYAAGLAIMLILTRRALDWWKSRYREPFHRRILRPPGYGCLERREDATLSGLGWCTSFFAATTGLFGFLFGKGFPEYGWIFFGIGMVLAGIVCGRKMYGLLIAARTARLGFLGEVAVAEELEPLLREGWFVYHDVVLAGNSGKKFNLDHVAIGPTGVFAIETKAWSKPRSLSGSDGNKLTVEGEKVTFPDYRKPKSPLRQVKGAAASLSEILELDCGEKTFIEGVVVTPGWPVHYKGNATRNIRDPRNLAAYLIRDRREKLSTASQKAFATAVETRCRTLEFETN